MPKPSAPSLNALRVFDVAARADSFKQAAQQLGVTQAAVTRQIQALERQLDMSLFHRDNRVHSLTPAGLELAPQLESIFKQLDNTLARARHINDNNTTTLTIAIATSRLRFWLNQQLNDFQSLYPHIQLNFVSCDEYLTPNSAAKLATQLQHDSIDLLVTVGDIKDNHIKSHNLQPVTLVPCAFSDDPEQLWRKPWLVDQSNKTHLRLLKEHGQKLKKTPFIHCDDTQMALELVNSQNRVCLIDSRYQHAPSFPKVNCFNDCAVNTSDNVKLYYRKRRQQSVALVAFIKWLQLISANEAS